MKLIEAMKRVKANHQKITDLQALIAKNCASLSYETHAYKDPSGQIREWLQSCIDTSKENTRLLVAISKTNLATPVTINLGGVAVTKSIAEWVWRRREYATIDHKTWSQLSDRGLREGQTPSTTGGEPLKVTILRHFDRAEADKMLAMYKQEPFEIDSALEVANAVTDLIES